MSTHISFRSRPASSESEIVRDIIRTLSSGDFIHLQNLQMNWCDFEHVSPEELATIVSLLDSIDLSYSSKIRAPHLKALYTTISGFDKKMTSLDMTGINHILVEPKYLASAISNINFIRLNNCNITKNQLCSIYEHMFAYKTRAPLGFSLCWTNHSEIPKSILIPCLSNLRYIELIRCNLTMSQLRSFYDCMWNNIRFDSNNIPYSKLEELNITDSDHQNVDINHLIGVIITTKAVSLNSCNLTNYQLSGIYHAILHGWKVNLNRLSICYSDHRYVEPVLLGSALAKLEHVYLLFCHFTDAQVCSIIERLNLKSDELLFMVRDRYLLTKDFCKSTIWNWMLSLSKRKSHEL